MAHNQDLSSVLPASQSGGGYGQLETVSSLSQGAQGIDRQCLEHGNPNNCTDLAPALPLDQYRLNVDPNPHIIRRKANEKVQHVQEVVVKYLKPPPPPPAGDIVIRQMGGKQHAPAPPLIVRQRGPQAPTPPPIVIREAPPTPPQPLPGKQICLPGRTIPPPARKVIIERLPPTPAKPPCVLIERWLPYGQQTQRIIFESAKPVCAIPDPKNCIIQWEAPEVEIRTDVKNLGVHEADPREYAARYGSQLVRGDQLPEIAKKYSNQSGVQLAANSRQEQSVNVVGDLQALRLIDLDREGLGHLRSKLSGSLSDLSSQGRPDYSSGPAQSSQFSSTSASFGSSGALNLSGGASHQSSFGNNNNASFGSSGALNLYGGASYQSSFGNNNNASFGGSSSAFNQSSNNASFGGASYQSGYNNASFGSSSASGNCFDAPAAVAAPPPVQSSCFDNYVEPTPAPAPAPAYQASGCY